MTAHDEGIDLGPDDRHERTGVELALLDRTSGETLYASGFAGLVDQILPGHESAGAEERMLLRLDALAVAASIAQAAVLVDVDLDDFDEDTLTVLFHDRSAQVIEFAEWAGDVPLLLLATSYEPFSATPAPTGEHIVWLDPSTERTFIEALCACGSVELLSRTAD